MQVVIFAVGDVAEAENTAQSIQQCMHLTGGLGRTEVGQQKY
jgi:hypothetical protein